MSFGVILKNVGHLVFNQNYSEAITKGIKATAEAHKAAGRSKYTNIFRNVEDEFIKANKEFVTKKGAKPLHKTLWQSFKTIPKKIVQGWNVGGRLADKAGKTGLSKFWSQLKGVGKGIGKRMPVIGAALMVAFELPNIFSAFKDKGLVGGVMEIGKSGARLGGFMAGMTIGAAFGGPIGGIVGGFIGDWLVSKVVGKSHSEEKAEAEQLAMAQQGQLQTPIQQTPQYTLAAATNPSAGLPQATMTPQQLAMLQQQLYGGGNFMNDDFMANATGMNRLNYIG